MKKRHRAAELCGVDSEVFAFSQSEADGEADIAAVVAVVHGWRRRTGTRCRYDTVRPLVMMRVGMVLVGLMRMGLVFVMPVVNLVPGFGCRLVVRCSLCDCRKHSQHGKDDELFHT